MKFFIAAKNLSGQVIVAEIIEAKDFDEALITAREIAEKIAGRGHYRITAINEYVELGSLSLGSRVAEFLGAER
jgi:hypothetical protein